MLRKWHYLYSRITFLMAFPGIVLIFNLSMYFFIALFFQASNKLSSYSANFRSTIPIWAILFGLGAVLSVFNVPDGIGSPNFYRSLASLPNYIYWAVMILFFIRYRRIVDIELFRKYAFYGVLLYLPFWFIHQYFLKGLPFLQDTSENNFAFLMITYSSIAISYLKYNKSIRSAFLLYVLVLGVMLFLERRAGFVLVFISGILTLFVKGIRLKDLLKYGMLFIAFSITLQLAVVKDAIESSSPRIYQLIYERDEMMEEDRSYLTRVAMVEKGLDLFEKHPLTGIGIVNFSHTEGEIEGNFEGSQFVIDKEQINSLSAHNSFVAALSEGGLFMFVPWILLLVTIILKFGMNITEIENKNFPLFWSFFGMISHYSSGTVYVNVYSWFIIAMCSVVLTRVGETHINNYKEVN